MIVLTFTKGSPQKLAQMIKDIPKDAHEGAVRGIEQSLDVWENATRDIAQEDTGHLKNMIRPDPGGVVQTGSWLDLQGTLRIDAYTRPYKGQPFNYALYWYEKGNTSGYNLSGDPKAIDTAGKAHEASFFALVAQEVRMSWIKAGW